MARLFTFILMLLILVFAIVVGSQNDQLVTVNYLIAQTEMRLSTLMSIMLALGVLFTLLLVSLHVMRLKWRLNRLQKQQNKSLQNQNT